MKAKRPAQPQRAGERRRGPAKASRVADPAPARRGRPRPGKPTAPAREPRTSQTTPVTRPVERPSRAKSATQAKARAKARKAKAPKVVRPPLRERIIDRLASIDLRPRTLAAKVPFVVLVIGSLGAGLGLTLWLSTDAAERSYQLGSARQRTELLQQEKEALERDVQQAQSAPALAEAARGLGMIPTRDTAHLVQDPAGNWVVVGTPKPAQGVPPPPLNSKLPEEKPVAPPQPNAVEVPALVLPGNGVPPVPLAPGPDAMVRTPDGATTLGPQHLPSPDGPLPMPGAGPAAVPGMPVPGVPLAPGTQPLPSAPAPPVVPVAPAPAVAPVPAVGPAPGVAPALPVAPVLPPPAAAPAPPLPPAASSPADLPGMPHHPGPAGPLAGEQFGPLTVTTPGPAR